ncbi:putative vancomycin B-type resistance protein VanW [Calothrix parasitica NIES-267]|uniref:Putative vancomycin B-type resistance protein VanW n=1 Tax=Calothrix parasitica NIES-267 TaxID=1973488 RepID=A0A1Z4M0D3_9CYAN|nr:putative vancomycin B-type resistance protein VanW [Calothrix parasitica NIES-267]
MRNSLRSWKAYSQHLQKTTKNVLKGYNFDYASKKNNLDISPYKYQWSSFTTPIKKRSGLANINENRIHNMQLAANKIDELIIQPQQIFGFWNRVPRPIQRNGFRSGPMLVRGKLIYDVGGGLCQISTTLFNALLWGNFEVLERYNHSIDAHGDQRFFTLGQDATVAYGYKDLIVRNISNISLLLRLQVFPVKAEVTASVWGTEAIPFDVKVESKVLRELTLADGGMSGWEVETKRFILNKKELGANSDWQGNYQNIDIYQPFIPATTA